MPEKKLLTIGAGETEYTIANHRKPSFVQVTDENDSTIEPTPVGTITGYGGGP